jgi:hypothetical protein
MSIPQYDDLFNPTLSAVHLLGGEAHIRNIEQEVAKILNLTDDEINEIHRGTTTKLVYRLAWSRNYLKRFGLLEKVARGVWGLTEEGRKTNAVDKEAIKRFVKNERVVSQQEEDDAVETDLDDYINREEYNAQVEKEVSESYTITDPFDPKEIDIKTKQMMLKNILSRIQYNEIDLLTDFQREGDLWDLTKQSRLIESILIRFPLPAFYFDGTDDDKWLIVDGLQRVSSLKNFVIERRIKGQPFALSNLEFLKDLEGLTYDDLPRDMKRRIDETDITVYIISPGTPPKVKYNLFKRINTTGLILEAQEIRHALNQGIPADFVKELAQLIEFKKATSYSIKSNRMLDRDFATRFVSFYILGYKNYEPDLDTFLNKGMAEIKQLSLDVREKMKQDFIKSMKLSYDLFGDYAFRKRYKIKDTRKPINKALFEVWSVNLAKIKNDRIEELISKKDDLADSFINLLVTNMDFEKSITSTTGDKGRVTRRFEEIEKLIKNILQ